MKILNREESALLQQIVGSFAGLRLDRLSPGTVQEVLQGRLGELELEGVADYLRYLTGDAGRTEELPTLCAALTNNETCFFREPEHFELLTGQLLPEIVRRAGGENRPVKLWSAGCSTGEEVYSLAIALAEFRRQHGPFPALILGTDIDGRALKTARVGLYRRGALRRGNPPYLSGYLDEQEGCYRVQERVREGVTFRQHNLVGEPLPPEAQEVDVIFCRNVLIYLDPAAIALLCRKLCQALAWDGCLFLNAAETAAFEQAAREVGKEEPDRGRLARLQLGDVFLFRLEPGPSVPEKKREEPVARLRAEEPRAARLTGRKRPAPQSRPPVSAERAAARPPQGYEAALSSYRRGDYSQALKEAGRLLEEEPGQPRAATLVALIQVSLGNLEEARSICRLLLEKDPNLAEAHFLLGLAEWHGDGPENAIAHLRRAVYSQPSHTAAHFLLAECYRLTGQNNRAQREYNNTLTILAREHDRAFSPIMLEWPPGYIERACKANLRALQSRSA